MLRRRQMHKRRSALLPVVLGYVFLIACYALSLSIPGVGVGRPACRRRAATDRRVRSLGGADGSQRPLRRVVPLRGLEVRPTGQRATTAATISLTRDASGELMISEPQRSGSAVGQITLCCPFGSVSS